MRVAQLPTMPEWFDALRVVGRVLDRDLAYLNGPDYHFRICPDWTLSCRMEFAGRIRLDLWHGSRVRDNVWVLVSDHDRLEMMVEALAEKTGALVG